MRRAPPDHQAIYNRNAGYFADRRRGSVMERGWISRFAEALPPGGEVLDLGCGCGLPNAAALLDRGLRVTGLDFSDRLLAIAEQELPQGRWLQGDMRRLNLGQSFDGILGWHSFFHLTEAEQRALLPRIAAHLKPGAVVCDVSRPFNVHPEVARDRPDVRLIEGGLVRPSVPLPHDSLAGPERNVIFACAAETILWALDRSYDAVHPMACMEAGAEAGSSAVMASPDISALESVLEAASPAALSSISLMSLMPDSLSLPQAASARIDRTEAA